MKKIVALMLTIVLLLSLSACTGGEPDPNEGKYQAVSAKAMGVTMDVAEVYPGETWVELKSGGKGTVMLDGDDFPMKWTLDGEAITITIDGVDSVGSLADGVLTVDLMEMGVEMTFLKEGAEMPAPEVTYQDAGYWEIVRMESEDPESAISKEDMAFVKSVGVQMYMELNADGTGALFMEDEMPLTWADGAISFTIWQAATPMWTVGISSMPRSALLRWSIRSGLPFLSKKSLVKSAHALRHNRVLSLSFQPVRSTLWVLYLPLGKQIRSPFSSRLYSFLDFAAHVPRSSRGRMVSII